MRSDKANYISRERRLPRDIIGVVRSVSKIASLKKRFSARLQNAASARMKRQYTRFAVLGILFSVTEGSEHAHHIASLNGFRPLQ
ncbi:hypothetical protein NDU88_001165 [Pleurodeles waltl]|uniref:Uncharacterized protein n=1 Tax=Pleurodeles waltl TaxID=8319 RepID=A0AAV7S6N5_PLEWA|nr:hypothetical protein NDU88_001165 [Pleurodeles waltl]